MHRLLAFALLIYSFSEAWAQDDRRYIEVYAAPRVLHVKEQPAGATYALQLHPRIPNRIAAIMPGDLYDVRGTFGSKGIQLTPGTFAWYSPEARALVVRGTALDLAVVDQYMYEGAYCPTGTLKIDGEVGIQPVEGEITAAQRVLWQVFSVGDRASLSASGANGPGYSIELEPGGVLGGDDGFQYRMVVKVIHEAREYSATSSATIPFSKPHTVLVGTTPEGAEVRCTFTVHLQVSDTSSPVDDHDRRAKLRGEIGEALATEPRPDIKPEGTAAGEPK